MLRFLFRVSATLIAPLASLAQVALVETGDHHFELRVDGESFFVKGVGGSSRLPDLVEMGGNTIRTWGVRDLAKTFDGEPLLDHAHDLGLKVVVGIWVEHERHGFNYGDRKQLEEQRERIRGMVRAYKDHPALLIWGLGNEMEGPVSAGTDPRIWKELNVLAKIVKEEDPDHPVMTVIAGIGGRKVAGILEHYPELDILGVNAYASAPGVASGLREQGWDGPFMLTEFGPQGHWEVPSAPWGAPIEPTSHEKAANYYATHRQVVEDGGGRCLGTFAFLWGSKQEMTATWYGMFLEGGQRLGAADAMSYVWTGEFPPNRVPKLIAFESKARLARVEPGSIQHASVTVDDPEDDPVTYRWVVTAETTDSGVGGEAEAVPPSFPDLIEDNGKPGISFRAPPERGPYRLFVYAEDPHGGAATANFPFFVE